MTIGYDNINQLDIIFFKPTLLIFRESHEVLDRDCLSLSYLFQIRASYRDVDRIDIERRV